MLLLLFVFIEDFVLFESIIVFAVERYKDEFVLSIFFIVDGRDDKCFLFIERVMFGKSLFSVVILLYLLLIFLLKDG
jgi:hypothetical protein